MTSVHRSQVTSDTHMYTLLSIGSQVRLLLSLSLAALAGRHTVSRSTGQLQTLRCAMHSC